MKVLIAGAPKTGNMWLKNILGHLYDIPVVDISGAPDFRSYLDEHHQRFVTHQHFLPKPYILDWGKRRGTHFITMARHPGDLFLSLYHYVNHYAAAWRDAGTLGHTPSHKMIGKDLTSPEVMDYLAEDFHDECLGKTLAWVNAGAAYDLRYEDLKEKPELSLKKLSGTLGTVTESSIRSAVKKSAFKTMRRQAGAAMKQHFRKGKTGGWRESLNSEHREILVQVSEEAVNRWNYSFEMKQNRRFFQVNWW